VKQPNVSFRVLVQASRHRLDISKVEKNHHQVRSELGNIGDADGGMIEVYVLFCGVCRVHHGLYGRQNQGRLRAFCVPGKMRSLLVRKGMIEPTKAMKEGMKSGCEMRGDVTGDALFVGMQVASVAASYHLPC
jgi:hypothetical protein